MKRTRRLTVICMLNSCLKVFPYSHVNSVGFKVSNGLVYLFSTGSGFWTTLGFIVQRLPVLTRAKPINVEQDTRPWSEKTIGTSYLTTDCKKSPVLQKGSRWAWDAWCHHVLRGAHQLCPGATWIRSLSHNIKVQAETLALPHPHLVTGTLYMVNIF